MPTPLSKAKRRLTKEWLRLLPSLASPSPRFLVRRHGPLLCGVCLDATSRPEAYVPRAFFHDLARPFPVLSIVGAAPVRDARNVALEVSDDDETTIGRRPTTRNRATTLLTSRGLASSGATRARKLAPLQ